MFNLFQIFRLVKKNEAMSRIYQILTCDSSIPRKQNKQKTQTIQMKLYKSVQMDVSLEGSDVTNCTFFALDKLNEPMTNRSLTRAENS